MRFLEFVQQAWAGLVEPLSLGVMLRTFLMIDRELPPILQRAVHKKVNSPGLLVSFGSLNFHVLLG